MQNDFYIANKDYASRCSGGGLYITGVENQGSNGGVDDYVDSATQWGACDELTEDVELISRSGLVDIQFAFEDDEMGTELQLCIECI